MLWKFLTQARCLRYDIRNDTSVAQISGQQIPQYCKKFRKLILPRKKRGATLTTEKV